MIKLNVKQKQILMRVLVVIIPTIFVIIIATISNCFDMDYFMNQDYKGAHFNLLTINAILLGFMFTTLGIFISGIESSTLEGQKGYIRYDLMLYSIVLGLLSIMIAMLLNIFVLFTTKVLFTLWGNKLVISTIMFMVLGLIFFFITIVDAVALMGDIRKKQHRFTAEQIKEFNRAFNNNEK